MMIKLILFLPALLSTQSYAFASITSGNSPPLFTNSLQRQKYDESPLQKSIKNISHKTLTLRAGAASVPPPALPTRRQLLKFYFPCLALWISSPLLSLVDTSFVGLSADAAKTIAGGSATQLAALGPATTFIDGSLYLFAFLNVATTNLFASARAAAAANGKSDAEGRPGEGVVRTAARTALYCGFGLMGLLLWVARPLIALYIGPEAAATPGLLDQAHTYVKIRALSMPTSLLGGVLQAALLGAKDSVTPLIAIMYNTVINVIGDYILVNRYKMGLKGAAIATLVAQWAGTIAMIGPARRELLSPGSSLGLLPKWLSKRRPEGDIKARTFLKFAAPVLTLILGKISAFGFMTNSAAGLPGQPATLAAHQIALSLFFFASPFLEVISQLAQSFLPSYSVLPKDRNGKVMADTSEWKKVSNSLVARLEKYGIFVGTLLATVVASIVTYAPGIVTKDASVQMAVKPLAAALAAGAFLTAPVAVSEGTLIARSDLAYLSSVYFVSTALLPPVLRKIRSGGGAVQQVWICFALFQLFRSSCFLTRIWATRNDKGEKEK